MVSLVRNLSIRLKLAVLTGGIVTVVVLGQTSVHLSEASLSMQDDVALRARLLLASSAGALSSFWEGDEPPDLDPFSERLQRFMSVRFLALLTPNGELVHYSGERPTSEELRFVVHLRLKAAPKSVWAMGREPLELLLSTPVLRRGEIVGYLFCATRTEEARVRLKNVVLGAAASALFWVALGAGFTLWVTRRMTRPLILLAADLSELSETVYEVPEGKRADGEIGVVQEGLAKFSRNLAQERREVSRLTERLHHQVNVVTRGLEETSARLRSIFDATRDGIVVVERDGTVSSANRQADRYFGRDLVGSVLWEQTEGTASLKQSIAHAFATRRPMMIHTHVDSMAAPRGRYLRIRIAPPALETEGLEGLILMVEDISETRVLQEQMLHSERLNSIGTLTAGLAHQLGNQLQSIQGYAALAQGRPGAEDPKLQSHLDHIRREVARASDLMTRVLKLARNRPHRATAFSLSTVVRDALEFVRPLASSNKIQIVDGFSSQPWPLHGDPQLLTEALLNLLLNAIQAMPDGGTLSVSIDAGDGDDCVLRVRDTGVGIPEAVRSRIFDPFFTSKAEGEGTGLGLAIAARVFDTHRAVVHVTSEPGRGTTFEIAFPADPERGGP